ncbi:hypothetical protein H4R26_005902 [Coemansia thaxteri]|uniref:Uncharacterized protein n=1 Tax=Coemansia thaxteri TaxID=2663907 RepID=A0A9W8BC03_9FUNG|nr:hypothetical protein H4R26_005902 [Coemansia thaxteri]KAJ2487311.1 hypothetical protein EV174_000587 [Coemansia sp. RSA 2320]
MSQPPGGQFVAILRRAPGASSTLFSDPVYVAPAQTLPDLPDGLQYVVIHPAEAPARAHTLRELVPKQQQQQMQAQAQMQMQMQPPVALPAEEDYGGFGSFLPTRDSTLSTVAVADLGMLRRSEQHQQPPAGNIDQVSGADVEAALEVAGRVLATAAAEDDADSVLRANAALLAQLEAMQDRRAQSGDYGHVSREEHAVAARLHASLARLAAAHAPAALRPAHPYALRAAAARVKAAASPDYAGTLPPQRRYTHGG